MNGVINEIILKKAIEKWGVESQHDMIIEECLELALALQNLKRERGDLKQKITNIIDEIADVEIMIKQAKIMFGEQRVNDRIDIKMIRLRMRIEDDHKLMKESKPSPSINLGEEEPKPQCKTR